MESFQEFILHQKSDEKQAETLNQACSWTANDQVFFSLRGRWFTKKKKKKKKKKKNKIIKKIKKN